MQLASQSHKKVWLLLVFVASQLLSYFTSLPGIDVNYIPILSVEQLLRSKLLRSMLVHMRLVLSGCNWHE